MDYMRYREFIAYLEKSAEDDDTMRVVENRYVAETSAQWLCLKPGKEGGIALIRSRHNGLAPSDCAVAVRIDPTVMLTALSAVLASPSMMTLARSILSRAHPDPFDIDAALFAEGLKGLAVNPYTELADKADRHAPVRKPPSLAVELWRRIPHDARREYLKAMAHGLRRGVHPDDTVAAMLGT